MISAKPWLALLLTAWLTLPTMFVPTALAASAKGEVEALQMPAWLTRNGKRVPLEIGAPLRVGDTIDTGEGARVVLKLAEGSAIKLGEKARFELTGIEQASQGEDMFKGTLAVHEGAFRLTTPPRARAYVKREIDVHFKTVTASITGTDIWGKSGIDREIVALVDGEVTVNRKDEPPVTLNESRSVYIAPADAPSRPVSKITLAQLNGFAQETEMQAGGGGAGKGGNWKVYATRTPDREEALAVFEKLQEAGFAATIQQAFNGGKQIYAVRIAGVLSEADGVAIAAKLRIQLKLQNVSVSLS